MRAPLHLDDADHMSKFDVLDYVNYKLGLDCLIYTYYYTFTNCCDCVFTNSLLNIEYSVVYYLQEEFGEGLGAVHYLPGFLPSHLQVPFLS